MVGFCFQSIAFKFDEIYLLSDHGVTTIGSNTKVLKTFASDFDDQTR